MTLARTETHATWPDALGLYERHLGASGAIRHRLRDVRRLVAYLGHGDGRVPRPGSVTADDIERHLCELVAAGAPEGRIGRALVSVREFFGHLAGLGLIDRDPSTGIHPPRATDRLGLPRPLALREVHRLLARADRRAALALRDGAIVHFLAVAGLRAAELRALDIEHLDHETRDLAVLGRRGRRGRLLPLSTASFQAIEGYLDGARPHLARATDRPSRALFLTTRGQRLRPEHVARVLDRFGAEIGSKVLLTPAVFRATLAQELHRGGLDLDATRLVLGHRKLATTAALIRSGADRAPGR